MAERGRRGHAAKYDVVALLEWRDARKRQAETDLSLERERALLARAQREKVLMANDATRGELLPRDIVLAEGQHLMKAVCAKIRGLPRRLTSAGLITRDAERQVAELLVDVMTEISQFETLGDLKRAQREAPKD